MSADGLEGLVTALSRVAEEFELDGLRATKQVSDGRMLNLAVWGELLTIEDEAGHWVVIPRPVP